MPPVKISQIPTAVNVLQDLQEKTAKVGIFLKLYHQHVARYGSRYVSHWFIDEETRVQKEFDYFQFAAVINFSLKITVFLLFES